MNETMTASLIREHGGPEQLRIETVQRPRPAAGEALVRVAACALNHLDIFVRRGTPGIAVELPHTAGGDISRAALQDGETLVVVGASGGVGVACVQLGKRAGARVIACTSSAAKAERLRLHGGALVTALDVAACFAAIAQTGHDCATVDLRTDFLRPALDPAFEVEGTLRRAGRRLAWAEARLHTLDGRLVATATGVFTW